MARWWVLWVALTAAGCYQRPVEGSCTITCDHALNPTCPSGLACGTDNLCFAGTPCDQLTGIDAPATDAPAVDAPIARDGSACFGANLVVYCPTSVPQVLDVPVATNLLIDTSDPAPMCTEIILADGVEVCVIAANSVSIKGRLVAVGRRPLVVFGQSAIVVSGRIDVASGGAGTTSTTCASDVGSPQGIQGGSAGGGAGGSFGALGGRGGAANGAASASPGPATPLVDYVHAGCGGGDGGPNYLTTGAGAGGLPGGAVYLLSAGTITIDGLINASGGGGGGGQGVINTSAGGGGGGSGGLIVLDATDLNLRPTAVLLAQGGGGGGGSTGAVSASPGSPPSLATPALAAGGGAPTGAYSGAGGAGSGGASSSGVPGSGATGDNGSGGGGGGGAGAIRYYYTGQLTVTTGNVYPPVP